MKQTWAVVAVLVMAVGARAQTPLPVADPVVGVVEVANLDALQDRVQAYAANISAGANVPPVAEIGLAKLVKTTNAGLIEPGMPLRILFVRSGEGNEIGMTFLFTVKDATAFRASLFGQLKKVAEQDGLTTYRFEKQDFDRAAFEKAPPAERQNFQKFIKVVSTPWAVGEAGKVIAVGADAAAVRATLALARKADFAAKPLFAEGDANAWFNFATMEPYFAARPGSALGPLRGVLTQIMALQPARARADSQTSMNIQIDALESALRQLAVGRAQLVIGAEEVRLTAGASAREGTPLGAYLASIPKSPPGTLKRLPADAVIVAMLRNGNFDVIRPWFQELMTKFVAAAGEDPAKMQELLAWSTDVVTSIGDEFSMAIRNEKGFALVEALRLRDPALYSARMTNIPPQINLMTGMARGAGMEVKVTPVMETYKGRAICRWAYVPAAVPPQENAADAEAAAVQLRTLKAVFGQDPGLYLATAGQEAFITAGDAGLAEMKLTLDGRAASILDAPAFRAALAAAPRDAAGLFWISLSGYMEMAMDIARQTMPDLAGAIPAFTFARGPGIMGFLTTDGPSARAELRLPATEVKCVVDGFKSVQAAEKPAKMTPQSRYDMARKLQNEKKFAEAVKAYNEFLADPANKDSTLRPYALYNIALCEKGMFKKAEALAACRKVIDQYPATEPAKWARMEMDELEKNKLVPPAGK